MNVVSLNIRGMRVGGKASWVCRLRNRYGVDFFALQESHISGISVRDLVSFWGDRGFVFDAVDAVGRSGGLVNLCNPKVFQKISVIHRQNVLVTTGCLVSDGTMINILNVYAPQRAGAKKRLWEEMAVL